jgi:heptaprenylglyceryl phosphate synthase
VVSEIRDFVSIPIIVGGGIREPDAAYRKVKYGASFVVIGNALEKDDSIIRQFADAIHMKKEARPAEAMVKSPYPVNTPSDPEESNA